MRENFSKTRTCPSHAKNQPWGLLVSFNSIDIVFSILIITFNSMNMGEFHTNLRFWVQKRAKFPRTWASKKPSVGDTAHMHLASI